MRLSSLYPLSSQGPIHFCFLWQLNVSLVFSTIVAQTSKQAPLCSWGYEEKNSWGRERTHILKTLVMKKVHSPLPQAKVVPLGQGEHQWSSQQACMMNGMEQRPHGDPSISASDLYLWTCMEAPGSRNIMWAGCLNASATLGIHGLLLNT